MPKQTFLNLRSDKRKLIFNCALEEFAQYSFDQASINRIVEGSRIAKGILMAKGLRLWLIGPLDMESVPCTPDGFDERDVWGFASFIYFFS